MWDQYNYIIYKINLYLLKNKFKEINYEDTKKDIVPFIKDIDSLNLWSSDFFINITSNIN